MRFRLIAAALLALLSSHAHAYDASKAPRYASPDMYRPNVNDLTLFGTTAPGDVSGSLVARFSALPLPASDFKIQCNGTADDADKINAALAAAKTRLNHTLLMPSGTCAISKTIRLDDWSNVQLIGTGTGASPGAVPSAQTAIQDGTIFKWIGPAGGVMVDWQSPAANRTNLTANSTIGGIVLDGNGLAGTGLYIRGLINSNLGIKVRNVSSIGVDMDVYNGGGADVQHNRINYIDVDLDFSASMTAKGFVIGPGNSYNNIHHNLFQNISINTRNGTGFEIGNADSNHFASVQINYPYQPGGNIYTGKGMVLLGSPNAIGPGGVTQAARSNTFVSVSNPAGTYAMAGSFGLPSYGNQIFGYIQDSGEPEPVIESGASLFWFTTYGIMHNYARFEASDGAWALAGAQAPRTGVSFPASKQFASLAEFGTDRPLYILGPNPGIGYNLVYTFGGYVYGPKSAGHYGAVSNFDTSSGRLSLVTVAPGNAGAVATGLTESWSSGATGNRLGPSLSADPTCSFDGQTYFNTGSKKYRYCTTSGGWALLGQ